MKVKVSEDGVTVPKHMLAGADEVEIRVEDGHVVVEPLDCTEHSDQDPIMGLGKNPVKCGAPDASTNHDVHIYGS